MGKVVCTNVTCVGRGTEVDTGRKNCLFCGRDLQHPLQNLIDAFDGITANPFGRPR